MPARLLVTIIARLRPSRANARPPPPSRNSIGGYRSGVSLDQTLHSHSRTPDLGLSFLSSSCLVLLAWPARLSVCLSVVGRLVVSDVGINCVPQRRAYVFSPLEKEKARIKGRERESWETTPSLARVFSPLTVQPSSLQRDVPSRRGRRSLARSALPTRDTAELTRNITTPVRLIMRPLSTAYPFPFSGKEKLLKFSSSAGGKIEIEGNSFFDFLNFSYQEKFKGIERRRAICPTPCE